MFLKSYQCCIRPILLGLILVGVLLLFVKQLIYNPSISMTRGYYFTYPIIHPKSHDVVLICVKDESHTNVMHKLGLPYKLGECPGNTPHLLKRIVATEGDEIHVGSDGIWVNNYLYHNSIPLTMAKDINLLPIKFGDFRLGHNEYFVLGVSPHSYDSRYYGAITKAQIYRGAILVFATDKMFW